MCVICSANGDVGKKRKAEWSLCRAVDQPDQEEFNLANCQLLGGFEGGVIRVVWQIAIRG